MGVEDRDWFREESRRRRSPAWRGRDGAVVALLVVALVGALTPQARERFGYELPFGLERVFPRDAPPGRLSVQPLPGVPAFPLDEQRLYVADDWRALLADEGACPRAEDASAARGVQIHTLVCLVNFARERHGVPPVRLSPLLQRSALRKAADIAQCRDFAHEACGLPADAAARRLGYAGSFGENLFIAAGRLTTPRVALDRWLDSDGHRENLLEPSWRTIGVARLPDVDAGGVRDGVVWVNHFGT